MARSNGRWPPGWPTRDLLEYDQGRREWLEILLKAGLTERLVVDAHIQDLFATLAYDLDRFRRLVFDPVFLEAYEL